MKRQYALGKSLQEIADKFHISREMVRLYLRGHITKEQGGQTIKTRDKTQLEILHKAKRNIILASHGRRTMYNKGCRCKKCRAENARHQRERNKRLREQKESK